MKPRKNPQLLAPAGDFASVDAALDHGADALYVGVGKFNLRAHAPNFSPEDLPELIDRVHRRNRKVYYALNIMPDNRVLPEITSLIITLAETGTLPDAFIISDPGVMKICRDSAPDVPLHLSTQTGVFNSNALAFWKENGISRAVLPRELNLEQIAELTALNEIETEIFIHGAMCVSISGRCLMGAYLGQRHPNFGDCPQPCRWKYHVTPLAAGNSNQSATKGLEIEENPEGSYIMNARDLRTIEILPELVNTGVSSLKIEGRNKSAHYVAAVVKTYRAALDFCMQNPGNYTVHDEWFTMLDSIEHRPYTTGFYTGELYMQEVFTSKAAASSRIIGVVKALREGGIPVIDVKNSFSADETFEVLPVNQSKSAYTITISRLTDLSDNVLERAPSNRLACLHGTFKLQTGDMLRTRI